MSFPLLVFGEDWGRHPSSTQHLVARLAAAHPTLWVNSIGMRRPRLGRADMARALAKCAAMLSAADGPARDRAPFPVIAPRALSYPGSRAAALINRRLLGAQLRGALRRHGRARPVLWTSLPTAVDLLGTVDEVAVVYYCGDDSGALEGVDHEPVLAMERRLAARADLILTSHPALLARFPGHKTHLVAHGVDTAAFYAATPLRDRPSGKIAGFCGCIDSRLDQAALANAARCLPDWRFEFVGPVRTDVGLLSGLANVRFRGAVDGALVPGVLRGWDVALLPYLDNAMVRACNPLKLREYLASGTAIAAIDMAALGDYRELLCAGTPEDLPACIERAARQNAPAQQRRRQQAVAGEDWSVRAHQVEALINETLQRCVASAA